MDQLFSIKLNLLKKTIKTLQVSKSELLFLGFLFLVLIRLGWEMLKLYVKNGMI